MTRRESQHVLRIFEERLLNRVDDDSEPGLAALLADDFFEVCRSGRLYDRTETLARMARGPRRRSTLTDLQIRFLAPEVALLVYLLVTTEDQEDGPVSSWRSSLWRSQHGRWQIHFHQATPAPDLEKYVSPFLP
jgi:hypothetical protein